jgi:flagellar hook protein FlgE
MLVIAVVLAVFAIGNQVLAGQVITVDDDGQADYSTIQDAIDAAVDGDTVVVADGTYSGEGNRDIDFAGKAITLQSENGPDNCIIDCDGTEDEPHRGFYFHNGEDANSIVDGFTITNGYATATNPFGPILPGSSVVPSQPLGGAIYCNNAGPTITNCNIIGNRASAPYGEQGRGYQIGLSWYSAGGGIHCFNSNAIINNCTIAENKAENSAERLGSSNGGGIYCRGNGEVTITNCIVTGNEAFAPVGPITHTGKPFDMAIVGEGYFVLDDGERNIFTRRGAFGVNANAILVDPKTGYHVTRIGTVGEVDGFQIPGDSDIKIPYDVAMAASATSIIKVSGNLSADEILPDGAQTNMLKSDITYTTNNSTNATGSTLLSNLDQFSGAFNGDAGITISGYEHDGTDLTDGGGLTVNVSTDMGDLITYINSRLQAGSGTDTAALLNGRIVITDGSSGYSQSDVKLTYTDAGDDTSLTMPGYFEITTVGGEEVKSVNITIYDSIGGQHVLVADFVRTNIPNTWDMILRSISGNVNSITFANRRIEGIEFNGLDGSYAGLNADIGDTALFTITFPHDTSNPQVIAIDLGTPELFDGLTQFTGNSTAVAKEQDGYQPGRLSTVSVNSEGIIIGTFSNDIERDIARVQLALFNDPNALDPISHNHFIPTPASGSPIATAPGDNGAGAILGGYLENLNDNRYAPQEQIVYTDRKLDAAIDGDGYFVLNDGLLNLFTRIGSFDSDANSILIDPATGYKVQRIGPVGEADGYQIPGDSNIYISYDMLVQANPTSEIIVSGNLSADDSYGEKNINISIYDSQGGRHVLSARFVRTEIHTWDLVLTSVTGEIEPLADRRIEGITFNGSDGSYNGLNGIDSYFDVKFPFDPGATQTISFFFGTVGQFDGLTQFAGISTAAAREQDGYKAGRLSSVSAGRDGSIAGIFSNGIKKELATIQLALFQNPEYLDNLDNGYFVATKASGQPVAAQPGDNGAGTIIPKHLEDPNADRYFMQRRIRSTGQPFDMAIGGERYYFVLNNGSQDIFTHIGSFDIDADGMLEEPARGFKVQRIGSVGEENGYQVPGDSNIYISYDMLIPPKPTSKIVVRGNLSADASHGEKDIGITICDSQGDWHVLSATFVRTEIPNTWDLVINSVTGEIAPSAERWIEGITFNPQDGSYSGLNGGEPTFDVKFPFDPGAIQTISFFFGTVGQFDGLTQFARSSTAIARSQDGYEEGVLSSVRVNNEGTLVGSFSNGVKSDIAQIKVATFPAPWALETIDHGYFVSTATSGAAIATQALSGCAGSIRREVLFYPKVNVPRNGNSFGGGIYCTSPAIIKNCLITDNSSDNGGGVYCQTDTTFENCTISGNSAVNTGGGIYCSIITGPMEPFNLPLLLPAPADTVITNSILSDNIAGQGPQLALESVGIWLTPTGIGEPDSQFEPVFPGLRIAYSNLQGGEQGVLIEYDNYLILDQGNIDEYPCFVDAANGDYRLLGDSPCINSGDPNYIPEVNETDLDGNSRVINGRVDMGVYEMADPAVLFGFLYQNIIDLKLQKGIENGLLAKLDTTLQKIADENENNDITAINSLQAFINAVEAQRGKKISEADADVLVAAVQEILELLKENQS